MKPSPLSAVLADDLLLDRVGARLETDDDLGALLLSVAHQADTPISRAVPTRRRRSHRGLTILAALGVAVSGATVAAAVELAPMPSDAASGAPHTRTFLPPSLQALVMPFLAGTPFQGRLVLPFGSLPGVSLVGATTAAGVPEPAYPMDGLTLPESIATPAVDAELGNQEQQDLSRQKPQAKATQTGAGQTGSPANPPDQGNQAASGATESGDGDDQGDQPQTAPTPKPPKPAPTPTPTPTTTPTVSGNGATNGHPDGAGNGTGAANGQGNGHGRTTGTTTGGTTLGGAAGTGANDGSGTPVGDDTGDDPVSGGPDKHGATMRGTTGSTTSGPASTGTAAAKGKTTSGTAATTPAAASTSTAGTAGIVAADDGTVTP